MSLAPGTQIGRYEVVSLLGRGGMSKVYLARDTQLPRQVAIKILNKTGSLEDLQRFRQEARAASKLSHPNILSTYEFGEQEGFQYIVTELVNGRTLREVIFEGTLKPKEAIEIAIQIGNSLVVAHEAGIIHRDIKPENIMLLSDGYIKVLDFGLAKLSEPEKFSPSGDQESTVSLIHTKPGLIMGTVSYMSPEQVRGRQDVDARADIWSLGVVLYEMVTGGRPFTGESVSDVIAAILTRPFPSLEQIPRALGEILAKALSKEKKERYQSAKDVADDLRIFREMLSREPSILREWKIPVKKSKERRRARENPWILTGAAMLVLLLLASAIGGWLYFRQAPPPQSSQEQRKQVSLSTTGNVLDAVLSPDGTLYAYVHEEDGKQSLRLRQVSGGGESILVQPKYASFGRIQFSPDKNSIFYTAFEGSFIGALYQIPAIGGSVQKITLDIDSAVTFSPDGKQFAFIRTKNHEGVDQIIVANVDGSAPNVLFERTYPFHYSMSSDLRESLSWSPDGKSIACAAGTQDDSGEKMTVVEIDVAGRFEKQLTPLTWFRVGKVLWTKNGQDLIITAADSAHAPYNILRISRENGQIKERITRELTDYLNISFSADFRSLLAVADNKDSNLFVAPSDNPNSTSRIAGGNLQGIGGLVWTPQGNILYVSMENGNRDIWSVNPDEKMPRSLTRDPASDESPSVSADGSLISFLSFRTGVPHVWLISADGSDPRQLTSGKDEASPQIAPDGKSVFYTAEPLKIWRAAIDNDEASPPAPLPLSEIPPNWISVSPDSSMIAGITFNDKGAHLSVFSSDGREIKRFDLTGSVASPRFPPCLRWTLDGKGIGYVSTSNGVSNILVQSLDGGKPEKLTDFSVDRIFSFDWSKDGRQIAFARGSANNKLLLFDDF